MTTEAGRSDMMMTGLGRGGPIVSRLGLGTMTFGVETAEAAAHRQLSAFVDAGGTFIDTADVYGNGESEPIIGRWAKQRRDCDRDRTTFDDATGPDDVDQERDIATRAGPRSE